MDKKPETNLHDHPGGLDGRSRLDVEGEVHLGRGLTRGLGGQLAVVAHGRHLPDRLGLPGEGAAFQGGVQ